MKEDLQDKFLDEVALHHRTELMKAVMENYSPDPNELEAKIKAFITKHFIARSEVEKLRKWADEADERQEQNIKIYNEALDDVLALNPPTNGE
jgi:division protein CdvB (Snf7/Vps24/ESCRT-III family)